MARKARVEYVGAVYHVLDRGDRREAIFQDDGDRRRFLETLGEACGRTGWRVHAYVLMSNHYHLMIETPQANLVAGMRWFQTTWTMRFNARHRLSGHLSLSFPKLAQRFGNGCGGRNSVSVAGG
jgi:REP element-mobilizing transposase RayT